MTKAESVRVKTEKELIKVCVLFIILVLIVIVLLVVAVIITVRGVDLVVTSVLYFVYCR